MLICAVNITCDNCVYPGATHDARNCPGYEPIIVCKPYMEKYGWPSVCVLSPEDGCSVDDCIFKTNRSFAGVRERDLQLKPRHSPPDELSVKLARVAMINNNIRKINNPITINMDELVRSIRKDG